MTRDEWEAATSKNDVNRMYQAVTGYSMVAADLPRKLRLLCVAVCRRHWGLLYDERSRHAIEEAERYADGQSSVPSLELAVGMALHVSTTAVTAIDIAAAVVGQVAPVCGNNIHTVARSCLSISYGVDGQSAWQADLFRDVFYYRSLDRSVYGFDVRWRTPQVVSLAEVVYAERSATLGYLDPDALAVLSDVCEEAGCPLSVPCSTCDGLGVVDRSDCRSRRKCSDCRFTGVVSHPILEHLRQRTAHVRGCWAVDLLLGRE